MTDPTIHSHTHNLGLDPLIAPVLVIEDRCIVCGGQGHVRRRFDEVTYCFNDAVLLGVMNDPGGVDIDQSVYVNWGFQVYAPRIIS